MKKSEKFEHYWFTLSGGFNTLVNAMYRIIDPNIVKLTSRVTKIEKYETELSNNYKIKVFINHEEEPYKDYDRVFVTLPMPACALIEWKNF